MPEYPWRLRTNTGLEPRHVCPACGIVTVPTCKVCGADYPMVAPPEVWFERPVNDDWLASYRVVVQEGVLRLGELRVMPLETDWWDGRVDPGRWSADVDGTRAVVPRGGLPGDLLRGITPGGDCGDAADALDQYQERHPASVRALIQEQGIKELALVRGALGATRQLHLATIAWLYVSLVDQEDHRRRPIRAMVERLRDVGEEVKLNTLRRWVSEARGQSLLTDPPKRTVPGGTLTPAAVELLERHGAEDDLLRRLGYQAGDVTPA